MDIKDYSQQANQVKERYQDLAKDLRSSTDREIENTKSTTDNKLKKQVEAYKEDKAKLEETAKKNNEYYTEKTRDTISKSQGEFLKEKSAAVDKFDLDKREMRQQYQEKLNDVTGTYYKSAKQNNQLHEQSKEMLQDRFMKTQEEMQGDYNGKIKEFSDNAQKEVRSQKTIDNEKRNRLSGKFQSEIEDLRAKAQDKNFKEVSRLSEDQEKLRGSFDKERAATNEQQAGRIDDILKMKNIESAENQEHFANLREKISAKEAETQEQNRIAHAKESQKTEQKFSEDIKNIQRLANQKIKGDGAAEALMADNKRLQNSYEGRLENLRKNMQNDMVQMTDRENAIESGAKSDQAALKAKYNEARELTDRERDRDFNKTLHRVTDKNTEAVERFRDESKLKDRTSDAILDESKKLSKHLIKEQRVEFGKVVNTLNEKNMENVSTIKESFAKDRGQFIAKTQKELTDEKLELRAKLNHKVALQDDLNQHKIKELQKVTERNATNAEVKLEQVIRQNEKEIEMLKATTEERQIKQDQAAQYAMEVTKAEHDAEIKNLRNRFEKIIDHDHLVAEQQNTKISQKYEDQLDRERMAHQKEISIRTTESQSQMERMYRAFELERESIREQFDERINQMKISASEQVNSKKV